MDVDEILRRLYKRFIWLDGLCEVYAEDSDRQLKIIDQLNKTASSIIKLLEKKGVITPEGEEGLLDALSKIPEKVVKIFRRGD